MMRRILYLLLGLLLATVLAWGGLYITGYIHEYMHGPDSLFDRSRDAQNLFLILWSGLSVACGALGIWLGGRSRRDV
jgi:hypothetical protein